MGLGKLYLFGLGFEVSDWELRRGGRIKLGLRGFCSESEPIDYYYLDFFQISSHKL